MFIDFGSNRNTEFNDLAEKLITDVLRTSFRAQDGDNYLTLDNIKVTRPDDKTYAERKLRNGSMRMRVYGDIIEKDEDDNFVKTHAKRVFLGAVPYRTEFGTYLEGSDYELVTQPRNKPSVYTTVTTAGDAVSSFQLAKGRAFKLKLLPKSGKINAYVATTSIPILPIMQILGATDMELRESFGDYYDANIAYDKQKFYQKMNKLFFYNSSDFTYASESEKDELIKDYFLNKTEIDSDTTMKLLGTPSGQVDVSVLLRAVKKLADVHAGAADPDDRYDMRFNRMMTPSHLFADRLKKQSTDITRKIEYQIKRGASPDKAFRDIISKPMIGTVTNTDLSRLDPQYNLMGSVLAGKTVTFLGEGAISDSSLAEEKGRLFHPTQIGILDPTYTPQGTGVGLNLRAAPGLVVDEDGEILLKLKTVPGNRLKKVDINKVGDLYILQPGERLEGRVKAIHNWETVEVDASDITHTFAESIFSDSMQMVPFPNGFQGPRGIMAATQFGQAVALKKREAPRVVPKSVSGKASDEVLGKDYLDRLGLLAPFDLTIKSITDKYVTVESDGGQTRKYKRRDLIPLQYNTGIEVDIAPAVKVDARLKKGDPIFLTNFHDEQGRLALGTHLRIAYDVDADGYGVEDGVTISESAAKEKLVSEHFYKISVDVHPDDEVSFPKVSTFFKHKYDLDKLKNIDQDTGIVRKGATVNTGDVLACKVTKYEPKEADIILGKISRSMVKDYMDSSVIWDKFHHGYVEEVIHKPNEHIIVIRTEEAAEKGSKLTGRFGNKGVVSLVLPDEQMPRTSDGNPVDIILSPVGIPSRVNPNQVQEASLGRTGKRYVLDSFDNQRDNQKFSENALKVNGLDPSGREDVYDPRTGVTRKIGVGDGYFLKLFSPEKSVSARGVLGSYDTNLQPVKGGKTGSKALGLMEFWALQGHNAKDLLKEFGTIKSEKNLDFWRQFEMGLSNMPKSTPYTFDKFSSMLTAAGAKIQRSADSVKLVPVTDSTTDEMAEGRTITEPITLKASNMRELKDGLFDPNKTGGVEGTLWSSYELGDGLPHPLLEDVLRVILEVKRSDWESYVAEHDGEELKKLLDDVNITDVKKRLKKNIADKKDLTSSVQAFRFLSNLQKDQKLSDFIISKIPIIPPKFRPIVKMQDGTKTVSDLNHMYLDVMQSDKLVREAGELPETKAEARKNLLHSMRSFIGLEEPASDALRKMGVKGVLTYVSGKTTPKEGYFLSKIMKRQAVMTGRARIIPDPLSGMDEVGIPEYLAWNTYEPHIRKILAKQGMPPDRITELMEKKDPVAKQALEQALKENYVIVNRAPTLHKFSIVAGKPKLIEGNFISLPNAFETPLNADYDGDEVTIHAPATERGKQDAHRMMLSQNPFSGYSPENLTTFVDSEAVFGLHAQQKNKPGAFKKWWEENVPTPVPSDLSKKGVRKELAKIAKEYPGQYADLFTKINRIGIRWASENGLTVSLMDTKEHPEAARIVRSYVSRINKAEGEEKIDLAQEMQEALQKLATKSDSFLAQMVNSGAKAKPAQIAAILSSVGVFQDPRTGDLSLIEGNTSKGYSFDDFIKMNARARQEMIKTKLNVAPPGDLYKQVAYNTRAEVISVEDCKTERYVSLETKGDNDLIGRLLARDVAGFKRDTPITGDMLSKLVELDTVPVRSPLTCDAKTGMCAKCYGVDDYGVLPKVGDHINIPAVNSFSEALAQKSLDAKHSGRSLKDEMGKTPFEAAKDLLTGVSRPQDAVLAKASGMVTSVDGDTITIDDTVYEVPDGLAPIVSRGDKVSISIPITTGNVNTKSIANALGHGYATNMFVTELKDKILEPAGIGAHRRNIETVAKSLYRYVQVNDEYREWLPGDVVELTEIADEIREDSVEVPVSKLKEGQRLGDYYGPFKPLDVVTDYMIKQLEEKRVKVFPHRDTLTPIAKGVSALPLIDSRNWLDGFAFRYAKRNIMQALASGTEQSTDPMRAPVTAYAVNSDT